MTYRLLYDDGSGYTDLDLGDEKPAMNYQINNLNELKDRHAAFSQAIKLPKTPNNLRTLGFIDDFDVVADAAYEPKKCQLLCDGALLTPFGSILYVDGMDERQSGYIECQIVSGTADLFSQMAAVSNEDMGDPDLWDGVWTSEQMTLDNSDTSGRRRWPLVFTQRGQTSYNPPAGQYEPVQIYHLVPCYHFTTLVRQLLNKYGYNLESNLLMDDFANSLYISASKITNQSGLMARFTSKEMRVPSALSTDSSRPAESIVPTIDQLDLFAGDGEFLSGRGLRQIRYYAMQPGKYRIDVSIVNEGAFPIGKTRKIYGWAAIQQGATETVIHDGFLEVLYNGGRFNITREDIELNIGDYIAFQFNIYGGSGNATRVKLVGDISLMEDNTEPGIGSQFDFMQSTGFKSYKEAVQTYMQLLGAMVDVKQTQASGEEEARRVGTVRIYTFEELYRRRDAGQFVDWSDKLVLDNERSVGFSISNYAQNNRIALKENSEDNAQDEGVFPVNNRTLDGEKTLFTIPVEAGRDITYTANGTRRTVAVIPTLEREVETDDNGREAVTLTYKGCPAHLVRLTGETVRVANVSGFRVVEQAAPQSLPVAVNVSMQTLVDTYYARIKKMLHNAKTLSAYFNLTTLDIDQMDLFTPVWIGRYGAYFYISRISNFIAGRLTKVELIKM